MKIEASNLESALTQAAKELQCSIIDLEYEILQYSKGGFLGFGKKNAIIEVRSKKKAFKKEFEKKPYKNYEKDKRYEKNFETRSESKFERQNLTNEEEVKQEEVVIRKEILRSSYNVESDRIFDSFHKESKKDIDEILSEIRTGIVSLLESMEFNIHLEELRMFDENCVLIRLDGEDAALMIGKEAHRYKAMSYLLHSWINSKYDLLIRLEIAQFLENQIRGMQFYLQSVIEKVQLSGRGQTKPLDGVLIKIALEQLRAQFPNKYVGIKQNGEQRFVVINDFFKRNE
ncbi:MULTISPECIES: Jag N-terminal domain-containing protein [unclassified Campylobacter]|uniref:Jag N-terminal domain-containing protein n=1 Tax=unclassified Campylobacter TaxID=2593542 RepID=UPI001237DE0B|nr:MULTISPECIES: Jag N-terminal domain-containing protein [unclassified Campylobacter]KAA6224788.1 hypothetical protein FMM54_07065 [Campylobacter sp. LR185c]KAA6227363.1 hypothetical protein FMM55_03210 [Campylobacter sp. LR196d]KAA6228740.1 hypothetical protein FMM57_02425 [Campylobacter sp. LR286c]KAA6229550.1 hypothetical protein FMM56_08380 [Campylobacter sp. LR264d]KAA6230794.1 hypothetical protein FMM58_05135 [Campylobacter sp. LR291e]